MRKNTPRIAITAAMIARNTDVNVSGKRNAACFGVGDDGRNVDVFGTVTVALRGTCGKVGALLSVLGTETFDPSGAVLRGTSICPLQLGQSTRIPAPLPQWKDADHSVGS